MDEGVKKNPIEIGLENVVEEEIYDPDDKMTAEEKLFRATELKTIGQEIDEIKREYIENGITQEMQTVFAFMLGHGVSGNGYELTISDNNQHWKSRKDSPYHMKLMYLEIEEETDGSRTIGEPKTQIDIDVPQDKILKYLDIHNREWNAMARYNNARGFEINQ